MNQQKYSMFKVFSLYWQGPTGFLQGCSGQLCRDWKVLKVVFWCPSWTVLMMTVHTIQNQGKIFIELGVRSSVGQYLNWAGAQLLVGWTPGPVQQKYYPLVSTSISTEVNSLNVLLKPLSLICRIFGLYQQNFSKGKACWAKLFLEVNLVGIF